MDTEREAWEAPGKRRDPSHPAVAAFAVPKVAFIQKTLALRTPPAILDVGCGNGYFTHFLSQWGLTVGVDFSKKMLGLNPGERLVQGATDRLPFPSDSFDLVVCSNLLHHLESPVAAVTEMKRVSRRYVALIEPNRYNPLMLLLGILKRNERRTLRFTSSYLREITKASGLSVIATETRGLVTSNRMPGWLVPVLSRLEVANPLSAYVSLVGEKGQGVV